ncbi:MAG: 1,4-dihydroxy-6-naphthoate synthase [Pirellulaceae bacterium]|nr:1,4-dihydroxy-6-naphthoate synthase [Pirellulaceae bacterium]
MTTLRIGISTCPNDTFAFHALMNKQVTVPCVEFEFALLDIEQLNRAVLGRQFDVAKASFHLAMLVEESYEILKAGAALGFGVGPLLLASRPQTEPVPGGRRPELTLCPGKLTTAALLFELFYPQSTAVEHVVFSEIMPRLRRHQADFGVCIHEGRFTWEAQGLSLVSDLGERWEAETNLPLPLGGILARKDLGPNLISQLELAIRESIEWAQQRPREALVTMRKYAQEFEDDVLMKHVELYVNAWTLELGDQGIAALSEMRRRFETVRKS